MNQSKLIKSKLSYLHQASNVPLVAETIPGRFDELVENHPDKPAVVVYDPQDGKNFITYRRLQQDSLNLAASLHDHKFQNGDRILTVLPNCVEFPVVLLALSRLGCNVVLFNPDKKSDEVINVIKKLRPTGIFLHSTNIEENFIDNLQQTYEEIKLKAIVCVGERSPPGTLSYQSLLGERRNVDREKIKRIQDEVQADDPVIVLMTSGSTGEPKGIQHTHFSLINTGILWKQISRLDEDTVMLNDAAMGRTAGFICGLLYIYVLGITLVSTSQPKPTIQNLCRILLKEKCTHLFGMIYMLYDLVFDKFNGQDYSHLRYFWTGGQPINSEVVQSVLKKIPHVIIVDDYGSTEFNTAAYKHFYGLKTQCDIDDALGMAPFPNVELKIVDENAKIVPLNTQGELYVRGPFTMLYYLDPKKTREKITTTRWFRTGDIAVMTENQKIQVFGRIDDAIKRGNVNIFPTPIEQTLLKYPGIIQASVIGVPDEKLYMEICACVVISPDHKFSIEKITAWCDETFDNCRDDGLVKPKYFLTLKEIPLTSSGKTDQQRLRDMAIQQLGLIDFTK